MLMKNGRLVIALTKKCGSCKGNCRTYLFFFLCFGFLLSFLLVVFTIYPIVNLPHCTGTGFEQRLAQVAECVTQTGTGLLPGIS